MRLSPDFQTFATDYAQGRAQLVHARVINDTDTAVSAFQKIAANRPYPFLLESVTGGEVRGRYSVMGCAPDLVWTARGETCEISRDGGKSFSGLDGRPLATLRALYAETAFDLPDDVPPMASGLFGYLGYDFVRQVEAISDTNPTGVDTPDALMTRPTIVAIFDQIRQEFILCSPAYPSEQSAESAYSSAKDRIDRVIQDLDLPIAAGPKDAVRDVVSPSGGTGRERFEQKVKTAKDYVVAGDVFQVVIGQRLEAALSHSPLALYRALRRLNPSPFLYFMDFGDHQVVGSSPEILVRVRDGVVTIRPIAGTRPRGTDAAQDARMEAELMADAKELSEHLMLLDLGRNDVGRVAEAGTVEVTESFGIERYSHVMHIVSNVDGRLRPDADVFDALLAGFPAGTVSGAPKVRAMEIIEELEDERRGIYGGAVGYISASGDMDTAIALRTAVVRDGVMHVRAGAGIVLDSNPTAEFEETHAKAQALFTAASQAGAFGGAT